MNLIATADIHIKKVPQVPWSWQEARYLQFISDIIAECIKKEAILVIAGDLADSASPKPAELKIIMHLFHELYRNNITTLLASGNHSSMGKGVSFLDYLEVDKFTNVIYRRPYIQDNVKFHLCNHDNLHSYEPDLHEGLNVLISHFRCTVNEFITEEIDVKSFTEPYDLSILGDIHMPLSLNEKVHYCNNPVNKEFEQNPECGYLEVSINGSDIKVNRIQTNYPSLRFKKLTAKEYLKLKTNAGPDYYKIEVEGTPEELRKIQPLRNTIIHKVPIVPNVLTTEAIEPVTVKTNLSTEDGLIEYMKNLKYEDKMVGELMEELRRKE